LGIFDIIVLFVAQTFRSAPSIGRAPFGKLRVLEKPYTTSKHHIFLAGLKPCATRPIELKGAGGVEVLDVVNVHPVAAYIDHPDDLATADDLVEEFGHPQTPEILFFGELGQQIL